MVNARESSGVDSAYLITVIAAQVDCGICDCGLKHSDTCLCIMRML